MKCPFRGTLILSTPTLSSFLIVIIVTRKISLETNSRIPPAFRHLPSLPPTWRGGGRDEKPSNDTEQPRRSQGRVYEDPVFPFKAKKPANAPERMVDT